MFQVKDIFRQVLQLAGVRLFVGNMRHRPYSQHLRRRIQNPSMLLCQDYNPTTGICVKHCQKIRKQLLVRDVNFEQL